MSVKTLLDACLRKRWMIATAESCTGGLLAGSLTEIPGSSDVFDRGFVTYSNSAKVELLGVSPSTLAEFGAVSREVAAEMANGALERSEAQIALSITGIAGPGGSGTKPEGLVCFGLAGPACQLSTWCVEYGAIGRDKVRQSAVDHAVQILLKSAIACNGER